MSAICNVVQQFKKKRSPFKKVPIGNGTPIRELEIKPLDKPKTRQPSHKASPLNQIKKVSGAGATDSAKASKRKTVSFNFDSEDSFVEDLHERNDKAIVEATDLVNQGHAVYPAVKLVRRHWN